ncbi:actin-like ATPase domain-containing protein [Hortaea werneckii]|nr:actin-like ATPase domain-containing protein [Hortaea werneckii]KAI7097363.1 actin-like ATPase domain-containing protein [Hortaea werneckii]KAI7238267.1 actin-like ATPase domain-containing protein [Hortaea werneckii]KAI7301959.1 actin-like ATPase domain-containing protein [Hortaea werneckii]KAI7369105.1 actin-like ATPase domain-containing protein [Hortaea werneckii]
MAPPADILVVGIDFGTTYSGVAHAYSGHTDKPDEINVIKSWPGGNNITSDKVPSEISYGDSLASSDERKLLSGYAADIDLSIRKKKRAPAANRKRKAGDAFDLDDMFAPTPKPKEKSKGKSNDTAGTMRWGYEVRPDEQRLRCLKLLLDPNQNLPDYVSLDDIKQQLAANAKNVGAAVTEYLKALFDHTKETLKSHYGEAFVSHTPLQVVLTVPAVWSDAAQEATLAAAKDAGIGDNVTMISEPEAAAVYALQAIQPNSLSIDQNFVVVDAGGGTVDLITYGIRSLRPLRLEEVVRGSGGCCGAAFLNLAFENFIKKKIGNKAFHELRFNKPKTWLTALSYFEDRVKRTFNPAQRDTDFYIPLPNFEDNAKAGIQDGYLCVNQKDVSQMFKPIVQQIIELVEDQVNSVHGLGQKVNALIMVGGFGQSEFLATCLRKRFSEREPAIEVLQPVNAWTAVVRGAVIRGLEGQELVLSRKARRHYGNSHSSRFDSSIHSDHSRFWDDLELCWRAHNQMTWFITKGETVRPDEPVFFAFSRKFRPSSNKVVTNHLIVCDDDVAPKECNERNTRKICALTTDLNDVPAHFFKNRVNSRGKRYQELSYKLGMQIQSGGLRFDLRVDDVVYGNVVASFD